MKALVCEMCGSHDLIKKDGVYVCESCGTKYSTEEARKLLIEATVVVDDSKRVENYLELARQARKAGNNDSAEDYCNKAIESKGDCYEAWKIKAEAIGWQSTTNSTRLQEAVQYYIKAGEIAPSDEEKNELAESLSTLCLAIIDAQCKGYEQDCSLSNAKALLRTTTSVSKQCSLFESKTGVSAFGEKEKKKVAASLSGSAARAWNNTIAPRFRNRAEASVTAFFEDGMGTLYITKRAIKLDSGADKRNLTRYENMLDMSASLMSPIVPAEWKREVAAERDTWLPEIERLRTKFGKGGKVSRSEAPAAPKNYDKWLTGPRAILLIIAIVLAVAFASSFFYSCGRY